MVMVILMMRPNKSWNLTALDGCGFPTLQLPPSYVGWNFWSMEVSSVRTYADSAFTVYLPHAVPSGDLKELPVLVMPTPPLRVFRVNTCSPAENGDLQEQATLCFARGELPPGAVQATATVPAPIILPTVVKTLPGLHTSAYSPQGRQNPPRLYRKWPPRSDHLDPESGTFLTAGKLFRCCTAGLSALLQSYTDKHFSGVQQTLRAMYHPHETGAGSETMQFRSHPPFAVHWDFKLWWNPNDCHAGKAPNSQSLLEFRKPRQFKLQDWRQAPDGIQRLQRLQRRVPWGGPCLPSKPNLFS